MLKTLCVLPCTFIFLAIWPDFAHFVHQCSVSTTHCSLAIKALQSVQHCISLLAMPTCYFGSFRDTFSPEDRIIRDGGESSYFHRGSKAPFGFNRLLQTSLSGLSANSDLMRGESFTIGLSDIFVCVCVCL